MHAAVVAEPGGVGERERAGGAHMLVQVREQGRRGRRHVRLPGQGRLPPRRLRADWIRFVIPDKIDSACVKQGRLVMEWLLIAVVVFQLNRNSYKPPKKPLTDKGIDLIRWLKEVIGGLQGSTPPYVEIHEAENLVRVYISFEVPRPAAPMQMAYIVVSGRPSMRSAAISYTVKECLRQLDNFGYFIPDFSYFLIRALDEGATNVPLLAEELASLNNDPGNITNGRTLTAISLKEIVIQAYEHFGFDLVHHFATRDVSTWWQYHLVWTPIELDPEAPDARITMKGNVCERRCEAEESVFLRTVYLLHRRLGYRIRDVDYLEYRRRTGGM